MEETEKRCHANQRERFRMRQLNKAYIELKNKLPWIPKDSKLTKLEILILASEYIKYLTDSLFGYTNDAVLW